MSLLLAAGLLMGGFGLALGVAIGIFAKYFKVNSDPRIELITELLPGANCGGCGMAGCADFAKSVASGINPPGKCPVCSAEQTAAIAQLLGIDPGKRFPMKAVVCCGGDINQASRPEYNGVQDCASAVLVSGGPKGCAYGCVGMGSCARKCPFGAIEIINNLAVVHSELCVGCGKCAASCPRKVIRLVPASAQVHVYCNNPEKGPEKRKVCQVPCLGCRKCFRYDENKFTVNGFLAQVNYQNENAVEFSDVEAVGCPTDALLTERRHLDLEKHTPEHAKYDK